MANDYYERNADFNSSTTARGSEVKSEFDLIVAGFDALDTAITQIEGNISNLEVGAEPGWGASIDTRWYVVDTSASAATYTATLSQDPSGENIQDGYSIDFLPNNANTGAATLNVGSLDGAIPIVKVNGAAYAELDADDMGTLDSVKLTFLAGSWVMRQSGGSGVETGSVVPFGGSIVPDGYVECYGQAISRITYADLFAVISTTYGVGNGVDTFNVPDFRGKTVTGYDNIGGTAANVLEPVKVGTLAGGDVTPPVYATWIIKG